MFCSALCFCQAVIDVKGQGYDNATYLLDLYEYRELGVKIQATYEAQRKKEQM
jgi:hypothetical protein